MFKVKLSCVVTFNSTLVLLRLEIFEYSIYRSPRFQFYTSLIETLTQQCLSMLKKFSFNSTLVLLRHVDELRRQLRVFNPDFQFYTSLIETKLAGIVSIRIATFQFYTSLIETLLGNLIGAYMELFFQFYTSLIETHTVKIACFRKLFFQFYTSLIETHNSREA